jgi:uncharacterized protein
VLNAFTNYRRARLVGGGLALLFILPCQLSAKRPPASKYFSTPAVVSLVEAAASGNVRKIDSTINAGADVNARGADGWVPLAYAMLSMNKRGFHALLERGADPNVEVAGLPGLSASLLGLAAQGDDAFWLTELIKHGAKLDVPTSFGGAPPMVIAIVQNRLDNLRLLIASGADIEFATEPLGDTPLLRAAMLGKWEAVYILLEAGADWRKQISNRRGIVDFLQSYSENPNVDRAGSFWGWRTRVAKRLKERGADIPDELIHAGKSQ